MKRIYISGPMTNMPKFNAPAFDAMAAQLRAQGHYVVNPTENGLPPHAAWGEHLCTDIRDMLECDSIHMLPGWMRSRGALLEHHIASELGFTITGAQA